MKNKKTAEEYIEKYYKKKFETQEWKGLEEYAIRFKKMYLKEVIFLRQMKLLKTEKEIALKAINIVNMAYNKNIDRFSKLIKKL